MPSTTVCNPSLGDCDPEETCTGSSATCPADMLEPMTTECRADAGPCDVAESCTGADVDCPANGFEMTGTICGDAQTCTASTQTNADTCNDSGTCVDGMTISCGNYLCDGDTCRTSCTDDMDCNTGSTCMTNMCQ
jgi:hypothetical protein